MPFSSKPPYFFARAANAPPAHTQTNPRVQHLLRRVPPVTPGTRIGLAAEMLRASSAYRVLPVVEESDGRLVGLLTEAAVVRLLLTSGSQTERETLLLTPVGEIMEPPPPVCAHGGLFASEAAELMDATHHDVLPVVDGFFRFVGLVSRADLVRELTRPLRPPMIGGMATPLGVYLTTGAVSGGVGTLALMLTGLLMFAALLASVVLTTPLLNALGRMESLRNTTGDSVAVVLLSLIQTALYLLVVRFSPLAGYHAAEHQVVHAIERSEPLLPHVVQTMPRVHPRCGTNLVAGGLLLSTTAALIQAVGGAGAGMMYAAYGTGVLVALTYWRRVGGWLQHTITTRPARLKHLESGIRAAREVLQAHNARPYDAPPPLPLMRLWRMGIVQITMGFALGYGLLWAASLFPGFRAVCAPWLHDLLL